MLTEEDERKWYPKNLQYNPACSICRDLAKKDRACVAELKSRVMFPKIVALTGSTKHKEDFQRVAAEETLRGCIVLTVHVFRHEPQWKHLTVEQTDALDALFSHKISMCDELIVINTGGYIGEGTKVDIKKAEELGKPIRFIV